MKYILVLICLISSIVHAQLLDTQKQDVPLYNILSNPGFENGRSKWTASGGSTSLTTSGANLLDGKATYSWTPSGAQTLTQTVTLPKGLYGRNCMARLAYQGGDATNYTFYVTDGSNTISDTSTLTASTYKSYADVTFICPTSGSVVFTLAAGAAATQIYLDSTFMGENFLLTNISQASSYGTLSYAATTNCSWTTGAAASFTAFGADTDCPAATVSGYASAPGTKIPAITFVSLPPGNYLVLAASGLRTGATSGDQVVYEFYDGTNSFGSGEGTAASSTRVYTSTLTGHIRYTTAQSNITIQIRAKDINGTAGGSIDGQSGPFYIYVYRFPLASETAYTPDLGPGSWSGYHDSTCSWSRTNTAYGDTASDGSCALVERTNQNFGSVTGTNTLPQISFTPKKAGRYWVCANVQSLCVTSTDFCSHRLWDGTTVIAESAYRASAANAAVTTPLCGVYVATNTSAKTLYVQTKASSGAITIQANDSVAAIDWALMSIDNSLPMPNIVNSVVNTSTGQTRVETAKLNCDAASAITSQHGTWISSIGNISGGACAVTMTSGVWASTPYCVATHFDAANSIGRIMHISTSSATAMNIDCELDDSSACTDYDPVVMCVGAK